MFEHWKLMDFAPGEGRDQGVFQVDYNDSGWIDAPVPGDAHHALIAAGRIPDPFYDRNEPEVAWMEGREFWYRTRFQATGGAPEKDERVLLTFHGLDTYAVIYLNGSVLGRSQNMFHEVVFNVTNKLGWGKENVLAVRFDPPLFKIDTNNPFKSTWGRNPERVFMRKAQFGYGWDWGPRLPTIGIWRPVELKRHRAAALLGTQFATLRIAMNEPSDQHLGAETLREQVQRSLGVLSERERQVMELRFGLIDGKDHTQEEVSRYFNVTRERIGKIEAEALRKLRRPTETESALVMVRVEAARFTADDSRRDSEGQLKAEIRLSVPGEKKPVLDETILLDRPGSAQNGVGYYTIPNPRLWWTADLSASQPGGPALYDLRVTLRRGKEALDVQEQKVGIRTLALDQSPDPDEPGTRFFRFVLNGVPIFARGANWIPADSFVGAIPDVQYERLLTMARDANMNMLRVWGGGIYEHDVFYNLCDRLGLLVWQDFMFACAMYPENDSSFVADVEAEARYQVRRLRSHSSLAVWCGNNENQWLHDRNNPDHPEQKVPGTLYYDHILPAAVAELDGVTPYWLSSPYGGNDYNSTEDGDRHNWQVWHGNLPRHFGDPVVADRSPEGVSYRHYAEDMGRFISEFGMHAAPVFETLRRVIPEGQRYHHSPSMDHHNKDNPKNKGDNLMETVTGLPKDLDEYIDYSMIAQAEGLKFGIEHFRRRKPHCSGALIWQFNDCWPVLSWSLVDYYGFGKAGYFYTRRVFAPVLASFREEQGSVSLWITNDTLAEISDTITTRQATFTGEVFWEKQMQVVVPGNSSQEITRFEPEPGEETGFPADRYLSVQSAGQVFPKNRHFYVAIKDLALQPVRPEVAIRPVGEHEVEVQLTAPSYVYFFHLTHPSEFTRYSDNYFDLEAGETRVVQVWNEKEPLTPEAIGFGYR